MRNFKQFFVEKAILGLIENIKIPDIGVISAKLDSGNGAYNVIHGENIEMDHSTVRFTTINNIVVERPLVDTITINVGAGHVEERPVVHFNVIVGNQEFSNVPFSVGNRENNEHKVLIGKNFIQNELNALIDVSVSNVADQNMAMEGVRSVLKGIGSAAIRGGAATLRRIAPELTDPLDKLEKNIRDIGDEFRAGWHRGVTGLRGLIEDNLNDEGYTLSPRVRNPIMRSGRRYVATGAKLMRDANGEIVAGPQDFRFLIDREGRIIRNIDRNRYDTQQAANRRQNKVNRTQQAKQGKI